MPETSTEIPEELKRDLAEQIKQNVPQGMGARDTFCDVWPTAKVGLEGLRSVLAMVPGVNLFAGPAIAIVLAAGDAAANALCSN